MGRVYGRLPAIRNLDGSRFQLVEENMDSHLFQRNQQFLIHVFEKCQREFFVILVLSRLRIYCFPVLSRRLAIGNGGVDCFGNMFIEKAGVICAREFFVDFFQSGGCRCNDVVSAEVICHKYSS